MHWFRKYVVPSVGGRHRRRGRAHWKNEGGSAVVSAWASGGGGDGGRNALASQEVGWKERVLKARVEARLLAGATAVHRLRTSLQRERLNSAVRLFIKAAEWASVEDAVVLSQALRAVGRRRDAVQVFRELDLVGRGLELDDHGKVERAVALVSDGQVVEAVESVRVNGDIRKDLLIRAAIVLAETPSRERLKDVVEVYNIAELRVVWIASLVTAGQRNVANEVTQAWLGTDENAHLDMDRCTLKLLIGSLSESRDDGTIWFQVYTAFKRTDNGAAVADRLPELVARRLFLVLSATNMTLLPSLVEDVKSTAVDDRGRRKDDGAETSLKAELMEALVSRLGSRKTAVESTMGYVFRMVRHSKLSFDLDDLTRLLETLKIGEEYASEKLAVGMRLLTSGSMEAGIVPERENFVQVLHLCFYAARRWSKAAFNSRDLLSDMKIRGFSVDHQCYELALQTAARCGNWGVAGVLLRDIKRELGSPTIVESEAFLEACAIAGKDEMCKVAFQEIFDSTRLKPTRKSLFALMNCYAKRGLVEDVEKILGLVVAGDYEVHARDFRLLFGSLTVGGAVFKVPVLMKRYRDLLSSLQSRTLYNAAMENCLSRQRTDYVFEILKEMSNAGLSADGRTIANLVAAWVLQGNFVNARKCLESGQEEGFRLKVLDRLFLIQMLATAGLFEEARQLARFTTDKPFARSFFEPQPRKNTQAWEALLKGSLKSLRVSAAPNSLNSRVETHSRFLRSRRKSHVGDAVEMAYMALMELKQERGQLPNLPLLKMVYQAARATKNTVISKSMRSQVASMRPDLVETLLADVVIFEPHVRSTATTAAKLPGEDSDIESNGETATPWYSPLLE